jgi:ParB/RepB/Spo0J family partition protein
VTDQRIEIPIDQVRPDPEQPRQSIDDDALAELTDSIKQHGVLQELGVEQLGAREYLLIWGHRRLAAATKAGLKTVPCKIFDKLTDLQRLELQLVENDERQDLSAIDRAAAYMRMNAELGLSLDEIAERVGRAKSFISGQMRLLDCPKKLQDAVADGRLPANTAILVGRIPDVGARDKAAAIVLGEKHQYGGKGDGEILSLRATKEMIEEEYSIRLKGMPWRTDDAQLLDSAGPCTTCPFRSGNQDSNGEAWMCTKPSCFAAKQKAYGERVLARYLADGKLATSLSGAKAAKLFPYGNDLGYEAERDYADLDRRCDLVGGGKNWRSLLKDKLPPVYLAADKSGRVHELVKLDSARKALEEAGHKVRNESSNGYRYTPTAADRLRKQRAELNRSSHTEIMSQLVAAAEDKDVTGNVKFWRLIAGALIERLWHDHAKIVVKRRGLEQNGKGWRVEELLEDVILDASIETIWGLIVECAATIGAGFGEYSSGYGGFLKQACELYGVDVKACEKKARVAMKQKKNGRGKRVSASMSEG